MKLNQECIRDLLLYLEDNLSYRNNISINSLTLKEYSPEELIYCTEKLIEANYLKCIVAHGYNPPHIVARSITYDGHQFLDNIRDDKIWKKTKSILAPIKSISIDIISKTAANVITAIIKQELKLS